MNELAGFVAGLLMFLAIPIMCFIVAFIDNCIVEPVKKWNRDRKIKKGYAAMAADPEYQKEIEYRLAHRRKPASWEDDDIDNIGYHYD